MKNSVFILMLLLSTNFSLSAEDRLKPSLNIDQQLQAADKLRSSEPAKFADLLNKLQENADTYTPEQRDYLEYLIAYSFTFQGNPNEGLSKFKRLVNSSANKLLKFRANLSIINILGNSQNWNEGLSYLSMLLEALPAVEDEKVYQLALAVSAIFYNQLGQYKLGLTYGQRLSDRATTPRNICISKGFILEAKLKLNILDKDSIEFTKGIDACEQANETLMSNFIRSYLARLHINNGKPDQALAILLPKRQEIEKTNYARFTVDIYAALARAYHLKNDAEQTRYYALNTINKAEKLGTSESVVQAYYLLYHLANKNNEYKLALDYHVKYTKANKTYLDSIQAKHLAYQLAEHQAIEQETKIQLLDEQNKLLRVEQDLAQAEAENNKLFISLLIALSTLLIFWAYKSRLTQKRLRQMAEYDALTGIYNRGHFTQLALSSLEYCQSSNLPLSCILFDLDKFKNINDSYGHTCGDWVLKKTADVCRNIGRKNDIFVRLGGEEFCIFLPGCDLPTAKEFAELCRREIAAIDCTESGANFNVTASFGITTAQLSGFDLDKIIADADQAMYLSKNNGRNQVSLFTP
ncbi:GGDEF domain-containing protein [Thalassomonas haliotis]|uniref:diguanylate cyclase n=1 Tax=Thalassomonas haliotis TaxID=485448 RepID=A0ABY7VLN2_9GAMM|nr:GGDEF domain-containing protein [Thalassomonas haliotis]WDE13853.1 GGDEF domain-containing protein [Thalassomonas haliotis]